VSLLSRYHAFGDHGEQFLAVRRCVEWQRLGRGWLLRVPGHRPRGHEHHPSSQLDAAIIDPEGDIDGLFECIPCHELKKTHDQVAGIMAKGYVPAGCQGLVALDICPGECGRRHPPEIVTAAREMILGIPWSNFGGGAFKSVSSRTTN